VFQQMDKVRLDAAGCDPNNRWKTYKRYIPVPVCIGVSGIGKSVFAREGASYALKHGVLMEDEGLRVALTASDEAGLNICIECDSMATVPVSEVEEVFAQRMLYEYCKSDLKQGRDTSFEAFTGRLSVAGRTAPLRLSIPIAAQIIADEHPEAAILVNVDEAQHIASGNRLTAVLQGLGHTLLAGTRIFFTVTGLARYSIGEAIFATRMMQNSIDLPLLEQHHMTAIIRTVLPSLGGSEDLDVYLQPLYRFVGGVPRLLACALETIAEECETTGVTIAESTLAAAVNALTEADVNRLQAKLVVHWTLRENLLRACLPSG
jgi:hypothetical protein